MSDGTESTLNMDTVVETNSTREPLDLFEIPAALDRRGKLDNKAQLGSIDDTADGAQNQLEDGETQKQTSTADAHTADGPGTEQDSCEKPKAPDGRQEVGVGVATLKASVDHPTTEEQVILDQIADRIRERFRRSSIDYIEMGRDLIKAKAKLGHGNFQNWLKAEFGMSHETARRCMRAADLFGDKIQQSCNLPLQTLHMLTARSTPEKIVERVVNNFERGEDVDHRAIEVEIRHARDQAAEVREERQRMQHRRRKSMTKEEKQATEEKIRARIERKNAEADARRKRRDDAIEAAVSTIMTLDQPDLERLRDAIKVDEGVRVQLGRALWEALSQEAAQ